jgi:hypothetical protein
MWSADARGTLAAVSTASTPLSVGPRIAGRDAEVLGSRVRGGGRRSPPFNSGRRRRQRLRLRLWRRRLRLRWECRLGRRRRKGRLRRRWREGRLGARDLGGSCVHAPRLPACRFEKPRRAARRGTVAVRYVGNGFAAASIAARMTSGRPFGPSKSNWAKPATGTSEARARTKRSRQALTWLTGQP